MIKIKYLRPNYDQSILSVVNSIQKYFNVKENHKTLKYLDDYLLKNNCKNVVLVLFDGLGYNILKKIKTFVQF